MRLVEAPKCSYVFVQPSHTEKIKYNENMWAYQMTERIQYAISSDIFDQTHFISYHSTILPTVDSQTTLAKLSYQGSIELVVSI